MLRKMEEDIYQYTNTHSHNNFDTFNYYNFDTYSYKNYNTYNKTYEDHNIYAKDTKYNMKISLKIKDNICEYTTNIATYKKIIYSSQFSMSPMNTFCIKIPILMQNYNFEIINKKNSRYNAFISYNCRFIFIEDTFFPGQNNKKYIVNNHYIVDNHFVATDIIIISKKNIIHDFDINILQKKIVFHVYFGIQKYLTTIICIIYTIAVIIL